jgi:short-subunit dehydrogenase
MKKTVVISGGSRGIGSSIVYKFAKKGYNIITCSRSKKNLDVLSKKVLDINSKISLHCIDLDLSNKIDSLKFCDFVKSKTKSIDILVNNVGTFMPGKIIDEDDGNLELLMNTNLYSNYVITRGLISIFLAQKKGHIFNICSIASKIAYDNGGSYSISKFAFYGMSKCLREELKEFNVKVTSILPGATRTDSWNGTSLNDDRFIKPDDVAESIYSTYKTSVGATIEEIIIRPQLGDI